MSSTCKTNGEVWFLMATLGGDTGASTQRAAESHEKRPRHRKYNSLRFGRLQAAWRNAVRTCPSVASPGHPPKWRRRGCGLPMQPTEKSLHRQSRGTSPPGALQHQSREGSSRDSGKRAEQSLRPPCRLALLPTVRAVPKPRVGTGLPQPRAPLHVAPAGEGPGSTLIFSTRWALPRKARDCPNTEKGSDPWLSAIRPRK